MSRILVTGGAGAIGSNLVAELLTSGHEVLVLDNLSSGYRELLCKEAKFIKGSVAVDRDLKKCFSFKPEYVVHMAALFANQHSIDRALDDLSINGIGTIKILEFSSKYNVKKVVYISSSCIYGNKQVIDENDEFFCPNTPYAITKLLGERYCDFWAKYYGLNVVTLRIFNTYGPGEFPGQYRNVIPNFFKLALEKKPLVITGDGNETRDFNFVSDTVSGIVGALFGETKPGEKFNIASGKQTKIIEVANLINSLTKNPANIIFVSRRKWDNVINRMALIEKAKKCFGYSPKVDLITGLNKTFVWLKSRA